MLSRFSSNKFPESLSSGGGVEKSRGLTEGFEGKEHELAGWGIESCVCIWLGNGKSIYEQQWMVEEEEEHCRRECRRNRRHT